MVKKQEYVDFLAGEIPSIIGIVTLPSIFIALSKNIFVILTSLILVPSLLYLYLESKTKQINREWIQYNRLVIVLIVLLVWLVSSVINLILINQISNQLKELDQALTTNSAHQVR